MWGLIIAEIVLMGGSYIYHRWIENHPPPPKPADVALPRVDFGAPIPLLYGQCQVRAPIVIWVGNQLKPGEGDQSPGNGGSLYRLDLVFLLGVPFFGGQATMPIDSGIWTGDIRLSGIHDPTPINGEAQLFVASSGASFDDLSIVGEFYGGTNTQNAGSASPPTRMHTSMTLGGIGTTLIPGYRSQVLAAFTGQGGGRGLVLGASPQVPSFRFEVIALSTGTSSDMGQSLAAEGDPAAVIYDLITSPWGKLNLPPEQVDRPSFEACSLILFNEEHGYSRAIEDVQDANAIIGDVLKQIDGALYQEPTTGKLTLRLARADYVIGDLVDINPDNAKLSSYQVQGWSELPNQVRLTFTNREANYSDGLSIAQNEAQAIAQGGRRIPVDIRFVGCNTRVLADKLASRELSFLARPQVKITVVVDRNFSSARLLDVFTFTWPDLGIDHMIARVARADYGQLHDGKITLDLIKEVVDPRVGAYPD